MAYNPEARRKSYLKQRAANLEYSKEYNLKRKFGLSKEEYEKMLVEQGGVCKICSSVPQKRALAVDHCHTTRKVRGLLCGKCNRGIGYLNDDPKLLTKALEYLNESI